MLIDRRIKTTNRYKELHEGLKAVCAYHQWVMYDLSVTGNLDSYLATQNMRSWLTETLTSLGVTRDNLPIITSKNNISSWFYCDENIDINSLKEMEHEFYEIRVKRNKYIMVELS